MQAGMRKRKDVSQSERDENNVIVQIMEESTYEDLLIRMIGSLLARGQSS